MKESVKEIIKEELKLAEKRLKAAKILFQENMLEDAVNRAYYSIFYAAKAMLNVLGFDAKTHSGLISEFGLRIVKEKLVPVKYGRILRIAFEMRESSDYEICVFFDKNEVKTLIRNAEDFLKTAKKFVAERI
jgi:uncharacterized protein (UPF0332 family)